MTTFWDDDDLDALNVALDNATRNLAAARALLEHVQRTYPHITVHDRKPPTRDGWVQTGEVGHD